MEKAKFKGVCKSKIQYRNSWEHTDLLYEYRGHEYIVTKDNNGYMGEPLWMQHRDEQERIDRMIEEQNKEIPEWKYEGSAEEGFDTFWNYVTADDN